MSGVSRSSRILIPGLGTPRNGPPAWPILRLSRALGAADHACVVFVGVLGCAVLLSKGDCKEYNINDTCYEFDVRSDVMLLVVRCVEERCE